MIEAIEKRRSIRKFINQDVSMQDIENIISHGLYAPSSKNRQPWKFVVVKDDSKDDMIKAMQKGLEDEKANPLLSDSAGHLSGAYNTMAIMQNAPVIIFVINTIGIDVKQNIGTEDRVFEICNAQSIGAAIQNMLVAATNLDLGSLWICDTYFAYDALRDWLGTKNELYAAIAIGHSGETPHPLKRKSIAEAVEFRL